MTKKPRKLPRPVARALDSFQAFVDAESASGILLGACLVLALGWSNSPWGATYEAAWHAHLPAFWEPLDLSLRHWINDGLMALFFLLVGLEIKREVMSGELSAPGKAALPIAAALGGMVLPALLYFAFNRTGPAAAGWGIPMATDIAFALGVLALLGKAIPRSLKVMLTAVAIVDDLGAVLVIALFYSKGIAWGSLLLAGGILAGLAVLARLGVRSLWPYMLAGPFLWFAVLQSGVHATVAGVLLALTIHAGQLKGEEIQGSPLQRLEHTLQPWISFGVMPVFALANAGVSLQGLPAALVHPVTLGIAAGLILGKQAGVFLGAWAAVRLGVAQRPGDVSWRQIYGIGWLAGIGFTMSLFIAGLAFGEGTLLDASKAGILLASLAAGIGGWLVLRGGQRGGD